MTTTFPRFAIWTGALVLAACGGGAGGDMDAGSADAADTADGDTADGGVGSGDGGSGSGDGGAGSGDGGDTGDGGSGSGDGGSGSGDGGSVADRFDIVFSESFDDDPTGVYSRSTWSEDWGLPEDSWSDPCYDGCTDPDAWAEARLEIREESDGNRFMRHELVTKGSGPGTSGVGWWVPLGDHEELYLSYRVRFSGDDWTGSGDYHGKLPGLCGSAGCPGGGDPPTGYEGFSTRYMFHGVEDLFFYLYYAGMDLSDGPYGDALYFDPYSTGAGEWHTVTQRVVLDTPDASDGIVEGFHDGRLVAQKTDMDYRNASDQLISTLYFTNFLGGSGDDPADFGETPVVDFDDVVVYTYSAEVTDVPRGLEPSAPDREIEPPAL